MFSLRAVNVTSDKQAVRRLKPAFNYLDYIAIKREIRKGDIHVYNIGGLTIAVREEPHNKHFVIVGAVGSGINAAIDVIYELATARGFSLIRFHNQHGKIPTKTNATLIERTSKEFVYVVKVQP